MPRTPLNFTVPDGACDCHTHIFDPEHFPYAASRPYTPEPATIADVNALHRALNIDRVVISQPTVYGEDHACTLNAIKTIGKNARGVSAFVPGASSGRLDELHRGGMREIVIHKMSEYMDAAAQIADRPWNIEVYVGLANMAAFKDLAMATRVPAKLTLFGGVRHADDIHTPAFQTLLELLKSGRVYVELSAPAPYFDTGARLRGRRFSVQGADRSQSSEDHLGKRLAACENTAGTTDTRHRSARKYR